MKVMKIGVLLLALSMMAFAQHGHGGGGGQPSGSPGMGNMGGGNGMGGGMASGHGMDSRGNEGRGMDDMHGSQMGKQSPSDVLSHNTKLSSNLEKVLPQGMTAQQACVGFKNLGQCVAAAHVSHNLDIPFDPNVNVLFGSLRQQNGETTGGARVAGPHSSVDVGCGTARPT